MLNHLLSAISFWINQNYPSLRLFSRQLHHSSTWTSWYLLLLSYLCNYESIICRLAKQQNGRFVTLEAAHSQENRPFVPTHILPAYSLRTLRPTVLLRVEIENGYSVIVRALLDTGSSHSMLNLRLTKHLLEAGATQIFRIPYQRSSFPGYGSTIGYNSIGPIRLHSLEDECRIIDNLYLDVFNAYLYSVDQLPFGCVAMKMTSRGLPMFTAVNGSEVLHRRDTIWADDKLYDAVDLIIGQDLLYQHFYCSPTQANIRISPELIMQPTAFGLSFVGNFHLVEFYHWVNKLDDIEVAKLKDTINSATKMTNPKMCCTEFIDKMTYQIRKPFWRLLYGFIPSFILLVHAVPFLVLLLSLLAVAYLVFKVISILLYFRYLSFSNRLTSPYEHFILYLFTVLQYLSALNQKAVHPFKSILASGKLTCTYSPDQISYQFISILGCYAVNTQTMVHQKIRILIDTGCQRSYIFPNLIRALGLKPYCGSVTLPDGRYHINAWNKVVRVGLIQLTTPEEDSTTAKSITLDLLPHDSESFVELQFPASIAKVQTIIKEHHQVSVSDVTSDLPVSIIIGTDLLADVLYQLVPVPVQRNIQLLPNLAAVQTGLGYVLQGTQQTANHDCYNFSDDLNLPPWTYYLDKYFWATMLIGIDCLLVDLFSS